MAYLADMLYAANLIGNLIKRSSNFTVCDEISREEANPSEIVILLEAGVLQDVLDDLAASDTLFTEEPAGEAVSSEYEFIVYFRMMTDLFEVRVTIYCSLATNYEANIFWLCEQPPMRDYLVQLATEDGNTLTSSGLYDSGASRIASNRDDIYSGINPQVPPVYPGD